MHPEHAKEDKEDCPIVRPYEAKDVGKERLPEKIVKEKVAGLCQCKRDRSEQVASVACLCTGEPSECLTAR
jgi:hypothetical protein